MTGLKKIPQSRDRFNNASGERKKTIRKKGKREKSYCPVPEE